MNNNRADHSDQGTSTDAIRALMEAKTIALVGLDNRTDREAFRIALFLKSKGYRVIPVPVQQPADEVLGEKAYARVQDIPGHVDLVDVFVRSEHTGPIIDDAIAAGAGAVWLQLGIRNDAGIAKARAAGLAATQDLCTAVEYQRVKGDWNEKPRLIEKLASERKRLLDEVARVSSEKSGEREWSGDWSPRQQLLHVAAAEAARLSALRQLVAGAERLVEPPRSAPPQGDTGRLGLQDVLWRLAEARQATVAFIEALPEEAFTRSAVHADLGEVTVIQLLRSIYGHDQQHIGQLERSRAER